MASSTVAPNAAFLGVCERISLVREGPAEIWRHNVIGLRQTVVNFFYPASLTGLHLLLACFQPQRFSHLTFRLIGDDGQEIFKLDIDIQTRPNDDPSQGILGERAWRVVSGVGQTWL